MVERGSPRDGETTKLVCFTLHGQEYGADIADVKESMTLRPITRVFLTPPWLAGIINLRGDVVAVIDLAHFLGMPPTMVTDDSRVIVARHEGKRAGLLCDRLAELRVVDTAEIQPPAGFLPEDAAELISGIVTLEDGAALRVLDLSSLFKSERLQRFRRNEDS